MLNNLKPGCLSRLWEEPFPGLMCINRANSFLMHSPTVSTVQFSRSVVSESLRPHGPQHARLPCPSPTSRACSNLCPSSQWCHPTISSSVVPFSCLQSFPASGSFPMSQFFTSGIGASSSASVLPVNIQSWFPLRLIGLILQSKGPSRIFSSTTVESINSLVVSLLYGTNLTSIHDYWKNHSFDYTDLVGKVMPLLLNMLSRFIIFYCIRVFKMDLPAGNT